MKQLAWVCVCLLWISGGVAAQSSPVPFINQPLVPASVAPGSGAFTLTVNGSGFAPTAVVRWNGSFRPTSVLSGTRLQAKISASDVASAGTARVAVVNVDTHNETSDIAYFQVRKPAPGVAMAQNPNFSVPEPIGILRVGDFNNDGKLDVVNVYNIGTALEVDVYLGKGNAQFQPPIKTQFAPYAGLVTVLTGDFNGDHHLDLVVNLDPHFPGQLTTLFGDGAGGFTLGPTQEALAQDAIFPFSAVDVDGDGNLDLVLSHGRNVQRVAVLFGKGDGTFPRSTAAKGCVNPAAVGDFNEDGFLDLACFNSSAGAIAVFLNKRDGTFRLPVNYQISSLNSITSADVNGDGHLDLITDHAEVLLGKGDGTFTHGENSGTTSGSPIFTGDFNGDGKVDLVIPNQLGAPELSVLLGNGDGTFRSPLTTPYSTKGAVGVGDFNHDGRLDLVGASVFWQVLASLYPGVLAFGQQAVGTRSASQTANLVNADSKPLAGIQITLTGTDADQFSQTNNCPSILPVGGGCQIQVVFAPASLGDKSASLKVAYSGLGSPLSVALSGTGVTAASVTLLPANLTFATQNLKTTSAPQTATLTNTGSLDVTISNISIVAPFHQTNNCPPTLPVGQHCQIQVTFKPTKIGQAKGTLSVTDNAPDSPQTVALAAQGTLITLSPIGINFGDQKVGISSNPVPVTLSNQGTLTLNISQITIGGANPNDFSQTNNCGNSLPGGSQCTIQVTFTPTQTGTRSAKLQVQDDVNPSPQEVALGGNGT